MICEGPGTSGPAVCDQDEELLLKATIEASQLTDREREIILAVITKDELLRRQQQLKVMQLKAELQQLRRKGAIKVSTDFDSTGPDPDRSCGRCRVELGRVINRGAYCRSCRLKVCKGCREFNFRATDWVCTVCHKRMEIQAASGEWMNKLVKNKRSNTTKVYVPAADIIKRTIRRSWTISNPTPAPRWNATRGSPEIRLYNSLPRDQDVNNYPSLSLHQTQLRANNDSNSNEKYAKRSPTRRTQSEDVYNERNEAVFPTNTNISERIYEHTRKLSPPMTQPFQSVSPESLKRPIRINPLMQLANTREYRERRQSPKRRSQHSSKDSELSSGSSEKIDKYENPSTLPHSSDDERSSQEKPIEKHVSFDNAHSTIDFWGRTRSLSQSRPRERRMPVSSRSLPEDGGERDDGMSDQNQKEDGRNPVELCDIEPLSGTVFRKMTVRRRRQENMRKLPAVDAGWRRTPDADFFDFLLPDGEDWRLVFVSNSDSSSKEEDDIDSSSASSFPIDECDWDYFEPGTRTQPLIGWGSPFGSPRVYRKRFMDSPLGSPLVQRRRIIRESSDEDRHSTSSPSDTLFNLQLSLGNHHSAVPPLSATTTAVPPYNNLETHNYSEENECAGTNEPSASVPPDVGGTRDEVSYSCSRSHCTSGNDPTSSTATVSTATSSVTHTGGTIASDGSCKTCGCSTTTNYNIQPQYIPIPVPVPIPFPVPWNDPKDFSTPLVLYKSLPQRYDWFKYLAQVPPEFWPIFSGNNTSGTPMINQEPPGTLGEEESGKNVELSWPIVLDSDTLLFKENSDVENKDLNIGNHENVKHVEEDGVMAEGNSEDLNSVEKVEEGDARDEEASSHLDCENRPPPDEQSTTSSDSSDENDDQNDDVEKPRVRRTYNVSGHPDDRESDDALPSSNVTSDDEQVDGNRSSPVEQEDSDSSSGSAETDSNDTGTVADQKPKKFSRVFVVNHTGVDSSSSDAESSSCGNEDSSDNDTDTELDCTVILTNIKQLDNEEIGGEEKGSSDEEDDGSLKLIGVKSLDEIDCDNASKEEKTETTSDVCDKIEKKSKQKCFIKENQNKNDNDTVKNIRELNSVFIEKEIEFSAIENKESSSSKVVNEDCDTKTEESNEQIEDLDLLKLKQNLFTHIHNSPFKADSTRAPNSSPTLSIEGDSLEPLSEAQGITNALNLKLSDIFNKLSELDNSEAQLNSWEEELGADRVSRRDILLKLDNKNRRNWVRPSSKELGGVKPSFGEVKETARDNFDKFKSGNEYLSSPGLSDVSAESLSSSDAEKEAPRAVKKRTFRPGRDLVGAASPNENINNKTPEQRRQSISGSAQVTAFGKNNARFTSLVMITGNGVAENNKTTSGVSARGDASGVKSTHGGGGKSTLSKGASGKGVQQVVSVVTSDTTKVVPGERGGNFVVVSHTNRDASPVQKRGHEEEEKKMEGDTEDTESVTVITGEQTLSAFEEGLADDDSWVENLSNNEETLHDDEDFGTSDDEISSSSSGEEVTLTCSAAIDREDELRGYHRAAIDFTLHTIVEESCEESEVEQNATKTKKKQRPMSATELEKYFFFGLGDGNLQSSISSNREDTLSETSSIYSEGMESLGNPEEPSNLTENSPEDLASSRLEKYFLSGFMGFTQERRDSDGSVGSDSEGKPSPEQRRKRLVRARGAGRSHSSSLDNLLAHSELGNGEQSVENNQINSEDSSGTDSDTYDELNGYKDDGQFDTVKRKGKSKKIKASTENLETTQEINENNISEDDDDRNKTPQPELTTISTNLTTNKQQQSRDSGFVGSCDDLLKDQKDVHVSDFNIIEENEKEITDEQKKEDKVITQSVPPNTSLTRRDSFNNWSSDEETNLMMSKMRQFFKTMVATNANKVSSQPTTPNLSARTSPKPVPRAKNRCKPPQLVYFENELTRLMKTVPGIREDQVREIVEYLSSEDTWSDSYDSSDYTSSDLESASNKSALQQQISDSCKQIINKFDHAIEDTEGDLGDGGILEENHGLNKETAFVYQKLVASFEKMATGDIPVSKSNSPPLIAKVMHHIGSRLVALMHEVSSGESHASNSPRMRHYHRKLQQKLSNASSTTTDDDSTDSNIPEKNKLNLLPRSKSHDLLMSENNKNLQQSREGVGDIIEEKEMSDCERFSWRGSFESALLASDSRNRLSLISSEHSASASALAIAAKRRSAGDLLFSHKSLSREQLDRVRSCGSIGGNTPEEKLWVSTATKPNRRRSSVPDSGSCGSGGSQDGDNEDDDMEKKENRSTLPRSLITGPQTTNSLPRLPTNTSATIQKAQSHHFLSHNAKSARYRPPGFYRLITTGPKRAVSAPGLQPTHQRRGRRSQPTNVPISDDISLSEAHSSPMLATRVSKSATPSPVAPSTRRKTNSLSSHEWPTSRDDDIDRLVAMHHNRSSLSSLGLRSDSMASVYSGAGEGRHGTVTVKGQVEFGLQYNYKAGDLEIQIKQCRDLAPVDTKRNRSDPYVKVYLLPDKSKSGKRKTKVKKHTLNPVFDECLKFHMTINELEIRTLWLTVWHSDMFGRNDFLGEVMMALENKVFDDPTPKWYNLQERTEPFEDILSFKGDIIVALKFVPPDMTVHKKGKRSRGALHVLVKEAKALTAVKANGTSDPFVKSYLLPEKGRSSKQKTSVIRRNVNPVWNHTFVYDDVTLQELAERSLELTVWDHDRLASNEFLGGVRFSLGTGKHYGKPVEWMDATGKELNLWKSMLERPNFWVEGCLALRPTLDIRMS